MKKFHSHLKHVKFYIDCKFSKEMATKSIIVSTLMLLCVYTPMYELYGILQIHNIGVVVVCHQSL